MAACEAQVCCFTLRRPILKSGVNSTWEGRLGSTIARRYQLTRFLARGGMGAVFLCDDLEQPGSTWAIKEMLSAHPLENALVAETFRREAAMLAGLRHPCLPAIVDSFIDNDRSYLVMEYIPGDTLAQRIEQQGPCSFHQALDWGEQLAEVLQYLHQQQPPVIFRDLKPENVMLAPQGRLKLVDFGLARHFQPGKSRDTQAAGSLGYSPPEQWQDSAQSDARSDLYGWGAVMYFLLCGKAPTPVYGRQNLRRHRSGLDSRLESIVLKCLEPDPARRFPSSSALLQELRALRRPRLLSVLLPLLVVGALVSAAVAYRLSPKPFSGVQVQMPLQQVLAHTAEAKVAIRKLYDGGDHKGALAALQTLTLQVPQDGEAQLLLNNVRALLGTQPLLRIPVFSSTIGSEYEGAQMLSGLALAQRQLNAEGLVDALRPGQRYQLVLDYYECQSRQNRTLELYLKAAQNSHYAVALGPWSSQQLLAVSPIVESAGFPTLAPTASDPRTTDLGANCFTVADSDVGRVDALADFLLARGCRRATILRNLDSVVGHSSARRFAERFASGAGNTVAELSYHEDTFDHARLLDSLLARRPDCLFMPEYRAGLVVQITQQLRARGSDLPVAALAALYSHSPLQSGAEGLIVASYFLPDSGDPAVRRFIRDYREMTQSDTPSHREAYSYDSLFLLAQAIETVGFQREALRKYLHQLGRTRPAYKGVTGEFSPSRARQFRKVHLLQPKSTAP